VSAVEDLTFARGGETLRDHLAVPDALAEPPAILLIPDGLGLSDFYRDIAGRIAARGFATLAVDLYSREGAPKLAGPAQAMAWIAPLPDSRVRGDLHAAVDFLAVSAGQARRVGITKFCMGGQYALLAACFLRGLSACVSFHGTLRYEQAGCGHAFLNHTRPEAYRPEAAADAFERSVRFYDAHLSPKA
jgi:carboxymethylenebutenolidase